MAVIKVENLGKVFQIGTRQAGSLRETIGGRFASLFSKSEKSHADFWALQDVNFEVQQGQVLGIIGRNGAGKSTLLKILSRITEPSTGRIEIDGRVSSLLEVGTGFHPELTGRENIYLNGTILGMNRKEINSKFDEIVDFSGIEKFLDTPVKRFSSGMYVRLAFAVAAHLEPEILIIDEVLAVGDVGFQKKSLGKMQDVASAGRTVLFVSHNMQAVRALCDEGMFLQDGKIIAKGNLKETIQAYNKSINEFQFDEKADLNNEKNRRGLGLVRYNSIEVTNGSNQVQNAFDIQDKIIFKLQFIVHEAVPELYASFALRSGISRELVTSIRKKLPFVNLRKGEEYQFEFAVENILLRPGEYPLYFWLGNKDNNPYDVVDNVIAPLVISARGTVAEIGYDPSVHSGYFSIDAHLKNCGAKAENLKEKI